MILRGIDFGNVLNGSGALGFFNENEYWYQRVWQCLGLLDTSGITFVAKTATAQAHAGNMELDQMYRPRHWLPDCIKFYAWSGDGINAVALSNPGLAALLAADRWQWQQKPFFISLMSLANSQEKRLEEFGYMADLLESQNPKSFYRPFGVQCNLSCPNAGHSTRELVFESEQVLEVLARLSLPLMPKYNILAPVEVIMELNGNPNCDAICVSNTIPWNQGGNKLWGSKTSPLRRFGGGGVSGPKLLPLVCDWIKRLRDKGFSKPINGGGGIFRKSHVDLLRRAGASSVFLSSVIPLRPWRVAGIVRHVNSLQWSQANED